MTPLLWWSQIIGVGASVIGDMSSRPNWGLNELDFVFSTLVVRAVPCLPAASDRGPPALMALGLWLPVYYHGLCVGTFHIQATRES